MPNVSSSALPRAKDEIESEPKRFRRGIEEYRRHDGENNRNCGEKIPRRRRPGSDERHDEDDHRNELGSDEVEQIRTIEVIALAPVELQAAVGTRRPRAEEARPHSR